MDFALPNSPGHPSRSLALFCRVVDNFGDIGICWRLARQLQAEHGVAVSLWVDDLRSFQRICPEVDVAAEIQHVAGVRVIHWRNQDGVFTTTDISDIVIEFFGCDIPPGYIAAMAQCMPRPVWLNLDGLTAEDWVEGCHTLPSPHPSYSLTKHFFYPGFTARTGGLLCEAGLEQQRQAFLADPHAVAAFLAQFGVAGKEGWLVSLFCYPHAPVAELFAAWRQGADPVTCLVPEGVASDAVQAFLGQAAVAGASASRGQLSVHVLPFIPQPEYDKLLWACDLNFVRGEDSFVRAQWAGKPFIWHIYPQDKNLHHKKLKAFLQIYAAGTESLAALTLNWNAASVSVPDWDAVWTSFTLDMPKMTALATDWQRQILANGDMTLSLLKFCDALR